MGHEIHSYTGLPPAEMSAWHEPEPDPDYADGGNFCIGIAIAITPALIALAVAWWVLG